MKRIIAIIMIITTAIYFAACSKKNIPAVTSAAPTTSAPPETTTEEAHQPSYRVFLSQVSDNGIFLASASCVDLNSNNSVSTEPEDKRSTVKVNGKDIPLSYDYSENDFHRFVSVDGLVKCNYHCQSGKLLQISFWGGSASPEKFETEDQYIAWLKQFVSAYYTENWNDYVYTCETVIAVSGDNCAYNDKYDEFVATAKENEEISRYIFYFTRCINGIATSDRIMVSVGLSTGTVIVKFNRHEFDAIQSVVIDEDVINQNIESFLKESLSDSYALNGYTLQNPTLTVSGEKYYIQYSVLLDLSRKDDPKHAFVSLESLAVEI